VREKTYSPPQLLLAEIQRRGKTSKHPPTHPEKFAATRVVKYMIFDKREKREEEECVYIYK
jgi:hypothetical protein